MLNKIVIITAIVISFVVIAFFTTSSDNASTALIATKDHSATTDEVKNLNSLSGTTTKNTQTPNSPNNN